MGQIIHLGNIPGLGVSQDQRFEPIRFLLWYQSEVDGFGKGSGGLKSRPLQGKCRGGFVDVIEKREVVFRERSSIPPGFDDVIDGLVAARE
jgi:hypothetical protein